MIFGFRKKSDAAWILAAGLGFAPLASLAATGPSAIATINLRNALLQTREGRQRIAELKDRRARAEETLQKQRAAIAALRQKLVEGKEIMSPDAQSDLAFSIQRQTTELQRATEDAQSDIEKRQTDLVVELRGRILAFLPEYATQHGYAAVLDVSDPANTVIYGSKAVDITAGIVRMYDGKYPLNEGASTITQKTAPPSTSR